MHLQEDEIEFTNPVFLKIYYEMIHLLNQEQGITPIFLQIMRMEISRQL